MSARFPHLFEPGRIGGLELDNRIVKAAMSPGMDRRDGSISDRTVRHYRRIAGGGVGLMIVAFGGVDDVAARAAFGFPLVSSDDYIPGLMRLSDAIRGEGAKAALQLAHCGLQRYVDTGSPIKAPSSVPLPELLDAFGGVAEPFTRAEIEQLIVDFGAAAARAVRAGFDAIELHAGHGYAISNFLSPRTNLRTDEYGGDAANRRRFALAAIASIRASVPPGFPVTMRVSGSDYHPGGIAIEETVELCRQAQQLGIDGFHVSGGDVQSMDEQITPMLVPRGRNVWAAERVKAAVTVPVIASGGLTLPALAEEVLAAGRADFVSLGRPLLADPQWPRKARAGAVEQIRPCIRGNDGCKHRGDYGYRCSLNPVAGHEEELDLQPAARRRTVVVVGGGPAGIEAARALAIRGHAVTLYEARRLGGLLNVAAARSFKDDLRPYLAYLLAELRRTGVEVRERAATVPELVAEGFDAAVVATGARRPQLALPGAEEGRVTDVLALGTQLPASAVVIGAGVAGADAALELAERGAAVVLAEAGPEILPGAPVSDRTTYGPRLARTGVTVLTDAPVVAVTGGGVVVRERGREREIEAERVISAVGGEPDDRFAGALRAAASELEVRLVGDAARPGRIHDAVHGAHAVARSL